MRRPIGRLAVLAVIAFGSTDVVHADYRQIFRDAMQRFHQRNYDRAIVLLRQAIGEQAADTGERIATTGMQTEPYIPHYFLGLALARRQDCAAALGAWKTWETATSVHRAAVLPPKQLDTDGYNTLKLSCEAREVAARPPVTSGPPSVPPAPAAGPPAAATAPVVDEAETARAIGGAASAITEAEKVDTEIDPLAGDSRLAGEWAVHPLLGPARADARRVLQDARTTLDLARTNRDVRAAGTAASSATLARNMLTRVKEAASALLASRAAAPAPVPTPTGERGGAGTAADAPPAGAPSGGPAVGAGGAGRSGAPPATPVPGAARTAWDRELLPIVNAYLNGDHSGVLQRARTLRDAPAPVAFQVSLFAAASSFALYERGRGTGEVLRDDAARHVRLCLRLAPAARPDAALFSPRFRAFYDSLRGPS